MYSISALGKPITVSTKSDAEIGGVEQARVIFQTPKSEANLPSSYVFVERGHKDNVHDNRKEREISPLE